jgi:F plasmid transfer operon, TraF, protein
MRTCVYFAALVAALVLVRPNEARAQLFEDVGTRAQGMSGAFVGVADDATAVWWNPSGLATGAIFSGVLEKGRLTQPESPIAASPARRSGVTGFSLAFPSLGLSYYRLRISEIAGTNSTEPLLPNRQDDGGVGKVRSRAFSQMGVTIGQSLLDHLVVGSTLKLVRGGEGTTSLDPSNDLLDQGDDIDLSQEIHGDLDLGLMFALPHVQAGVTARNLTTPEFGEGNERIELKRQVRAGLAVLGKWPGFVQALTVAADADLTRSATPFGDVRHVALGGETWLAKRRVGLRGGIAANTIGERRTTTSTGVSVKAISVIYIDAARTFGRDASIRGWSTTIRITF